MIRTGWSLSLNTPNLRFRADVRRIRDLRWTKKQAEGRCHKQHLIHLMDGSRGFLSLHIHKPEMQGGTAGVSGQAVGCRSRLGEDAESST